MSRSSQSGYIAIGPQVSKGTLPGSPVYYKYRATDIDFGAVETGDVLPPEIAGLMVPTGAFKTGVFAAGGFSFVPRLESDLGWLLYALMGKVASAEEPASSGKYDHEFTFDADPSVIPWVNIRKYVPSSGDSYEDVLDCRLARMRLTIPQVGPAGARIDAVGRQPSFPENPSWTEDDMDDSDSFAVAGQSNSYIKLPSFSASAMPATGCIIDLVNMLTSPQQEMVIGSGYPDDITVLGRGMTVRFVYKWEDPALYRSIFTGAATGVSAWTPDVFTSDFEAQVATADATLLAGDEPFTLKIEASKVRWEPNGPIRLVGNNLLAQEFVGAALEPDSGEYCKITLRNAEAAYDWPAS